MIDTNYIIILFIILILFGIVVSTICYNKRSLIKLERQIILENFKSSTSTDLNENLIDNGDFLNGMPLLFISKNPIEPIRMQNPSNSISCIEIKSNNYATFKLNTK